MYFCKKNQKMFLGIKFHLKNLLQLTKIHITGYKETVCGKRKNIYIKYKTS